MPRLIVISATALLLVFTGYPKLLSANSQFKSGGLGNGIYARAGIYMSDAAVQRLTAPGSDGAAASHMY